MLSPHLALQVSGATGRCRIYHRRYEPHFVVFGNDRLSFPDLPPPAKQLLRGNPVTPRDLGRYRARRQRLLDNPRLLVSRPAPPPPRPHENLNPTR